MTYLNGQREILPDSRLFEPVRQLLTLTECVAVAFMVTQNRAIPNINTSYFPSRNFDLTVAVPSRGPLALAIHDEKPDRIALGFMPGQAQHLREQLPETGRSGTLFPLLTMAAGVALANFYESHRDWLRQANGLSGGVDHWPPVLNFGRAIRNFIAHSGRVYFDRPTALPVGWHHLQFSYADQGREVIGTEIQYPEMVILMVEMADELDRLGAPVPS
ncbi:hypothetical protein [Devosia sp. 919]|uniref:hypothetical protein n=1 Tax=Devosia sp. 919 TaxID=2726065 RepID=UPI001552D0F4|nr:hypothetical protein [Devosia sp. 919]